MAWQLRIEIRDAGNGPVAGATLQLSTRAGPGGFATGPETAAGADVDLPVPDDTVEVVVSLTHPRFRPLVVSLVRTAPEAGWRWNEPALRVATRGRQVTVGAVLSRMRPAPLTAPMPEADLLRRATAAKAPLDAAARARRQSPPAAARVDGLPGVLRAGNAYRHSIPPDERAFHILAARPLGESGRQDWPVTAPDWKRFATIERAVAPAAAARIHLLEYGEVGDGRTAPRLLVAVWMPPQFTRIGAAAIDFLVWFTPNTRVPAYPQVEYPFGGDYPYVLMANGNGPYSADQNYAEVAFGHWFNSHKLTYQLLAAQRSAAIVVPVAPSGHFELWESPVTLMRMLKEICRAVPRDDDGRIAKTHPAPPAVGRVGVAGFSSAGPRLHTLLQGPGADGHYRESLWGGEADRRDFDRVWKELWCIDGNFRAAHAAFLDQGAGWVRQQSDRQLRIYKNDFTDGRWDPRAAGGEFGRAMRAAVSVQRGSGQHWAVHSSGAGGRIQALSMSKSYAVSPGGVDRPQWHAGRDPHENMPLLCFGHAAVTSGFGR